MKKLLPVKIKRCHKLRDIADAILYILRNGSQWRNLPDYFSKWESVYYHFRKWGRDGILSRLNAGLNMVEREWQGKMKTPGMLSIDCQSVKAGPMTSGFKGIDGDKRINGRKRHAVTDTLGIVRGIVVGAANEADGTVAQRVVEPLLSYLDWMEKILADHAYKKVFMDWVERTVIGLEVEISSYPASPKGVVPIKWRRVAESPFGTFNFFRRLDKDHRKTTESREYWIL